MNFLKKSLLGMIALSFLGFNASALESNGWIVKFADGSKAYQDKSFQDLGTVTEIPVSFGNFVKLEGQVSNKSIEMLSNHPEVLYVEPNYIYTVNPIEGEELSSEVKNIADSEFSRQWGLKNTGRNSGEIFRRGKVGQDTNIMSAWDMTTGSSDIIVAVIDTGIDYNHPDLKDNMWVNPDPTAEDVHGYNFAAKTPNPMDGNGHGTHCAGVIGATHNALGIRGVMANVKLMAVKFLTDSGRGETADAIASIDYAVENGAHILSNSWGGGGRSEALKEAIVRANEAGVVFVAAAGNSRANNDTTNSFPANYKVDNVISVGAMDARGNKASFTNYGKESVHVFAPGVNIYSTVQNGGYKSLSGTSMAAPFVSGIVGLLISQESTLSTTEITQRVVGTSVNESSLIPYAQSGRIDAARFLRDLRN